MRASLAFIGVAAAAGYQWPQAGGSPARSNVFPPTIANAINGLSLEEEGTAFFGEQSSGSHLRANPVLIPTPVRSLQFNLGTTEVLQKAAPPVVLQSGVVMGLGPFCDIFGLSNPDTPGASWDIPVLLNRAEEDPADGANCYDMLVDEADNLLHVKHERNNIDNDTFVGYSTNGGQSVSPIPGPVGAGVNTGTTLPLFVLYNVMSTYVPGRTMAGQGSPNGWYYMPSTPTFSAKGMIVLSMQTGGATGVALGGDNLAKISGGVGYPTPGAGDGSYQVAFAVTAGLLGGTKLMMGFDEGGVAAWTSQEPDTPSVSEIQPAPLYVPDSTVPGGGRIYIVPNPDDASKQVSAIYCFTVTGGMCPGFPQPLPPAFDGVPTGWWYGGAVVPTPGNPKTVSRLIYTVDVATETGPEHIGCLVAISPTLGTVLDKYCVLRDPKGRQSSANFLGTAPVVAVDARGSGAHTVFVAQYDSIVLGFDPMNLAAGPLAVLDPTDPADPNGVALTCDYLTFTSGGSLVMVGYRKGLPQGQPGQFVVTAIPGVTAYGGPGQAAGGPGGGIGPGGAAGITVVVLVVVGAMVAFPFYRSGQLQEWTRKFMPSQVRYVPVPANTGASSYLGSSGSGYKGKTGFAPSGSYGSTSSASA